MPSIFTVEVPLRWGDMDAYGHVNNVTLLQILEEARVAVFGPPPAAGEPDLAGEDGPPLPIFALVAGTVQALVAEHSVKYLKPLPYRALPVRVEVELAAMTAASFTVAYRVYDRATGDLCTRASTVLAFFDTGEGRLLRLPAPVRSALAEHI